MRTMPKPNGPPEKVLVPLKGLVPDAHEEDVCVVAVAVVVGNGRANGHAPFTMFQADMASAAHF